MSAAGYLFKFLRTELPELAEKAALRIAQQFEGAEAADVAKALGVPLETWLAYASR